MSEGKNTPTPYTAEPYEEKLGTVDIMAALHGQSEGLHRLVATATSAEDAAFIIEAVNSHADLKAENATLRDRNAELEAALRGMGFGLSKADERVGWRHPFTSSNDLFKCEFCEAESLDCTEIEHSDACPVTVARAALAERNARGKA